MLGFLNNLAAAGAAWNQTKGTMNNAAAKAPIVSVPKEDKSRKDTMTGADKANAIAQGNAANANELTNQWINQQMQYQTQSRREAMEFSAKEAQKNREWQEMMSNTSYQRAMADMKKAGLNPILAYAQGGASTPAGASANGIAMSGAGGSARQAYTFKGNESENIFQILAMTGIAAMSTISRITPGKSDDRITKMLKNYVTLDDLSYVLTGE